MATKAASSQRAQVFSAYRRLYRARSFLFKGDDRAMRESRVAARAEFLKHNGDAARIATDPVHFAGLLGMVDEAVDMLRHGIVRGNLNPKTGHYGASLGMLLIICCFLQQKRQMLRTVFVLNLALLLCLVYLELIVAMICLISFDPKIFTYVFPSETKW
jgi:hypothetical protein